MLFIGTFLSKTRGTKGIAETLAESLSKKNIYVKLVSSKENKFLRMFDIFAEILFTKEPKVHIDVFSGQSFRISELASLISKYRNKKIYLTLHGGKLPEFYTSNIHRFNKLFCNATMVLTPSLYLQKFFKNKGYEIKYLPNSIDINKFQYSWKTPVIPKILWVRGFAEIYNPELAVRSFEIVYNKYPNAKMTMVGPDLGLLPSIKNLVNNINLSNSISFEGSINNEDLYKYYSSHSVFINTTSYESFGMAVLEAASCGIPIVSSPIGEIPLLWESEHEMLITKDMSAEAFGDGILRIINDKVLAQNLSKNARVKSEQFSIEKILPQWITLIEDNTIN